MQTEFSKEQQMLREVVSRFLKDKSGAGAVRAMMATECGYDPAIWQQLCSEVELTGTHFPEAYGGAGLGPIELGIIVEEMGRYLYCGPFFASAVMAGVTLLKAATETHKQAILPQVIAGSTIATLVLDDLNSPDRVGKNVQATDQAALSGTAGLVLDAHIAHLLIVVAKSSNGLALYTVNRDAPGVSIEPMEVLDPTRKLARVAFKNTDAEKIGDVSDAASPRVERTSGRADGVCNR